MSDKNKVLLLHLIESRGNIKQLLREGLTYKNISKLIENLVNEELIIYDKEKINLTVKGRTFLKNEKELIIKRDKSLWIETENESKIPKLEKDFIFLPNQNEIHF